ncbi:MAG: LmeA family phospholipid-binding protein [Xenococcaceae cyanobacterium]
MELITILFSGLLSVLSGSGLFVDRAIAKVFRSEFSSVKQLEVRVDNAPSYQILQGKADRIRLASRGIEYEDKIKIDTFEIETDAIDIDRTNLKKTNLENLRKSLRKPLQAGFHTIVTEEDLNLALQSQEIKDRLEKLLARAISGEEESETIFYQILNFNLDFLDSDRLKIGLQLSRGESDRKIDEQIKQPFDQPLDVRLEFGLKLVGGTSISIVEPVGTVNGKAISTKLLNGFARGFSNRLDLRMLEEKGLFVRLLQLKFANNAFDLAAFVRLEPFTPASPLPKK